ncbi:MAG: sugar nucleotide-binding protein [Bdellovibrio sp.]|nr:sugar nucleotide-binding protein [Methylotenera sp.]
MRVLVLGGNGFIGRNIVAKLQLQGAQVVIGSRKAVKQNSQLPVKMQNMQQADDWLSVIKGFDVVVNSVGILRERKGESYAKIHTFSVESLADACAQTGIKLIQISAIGLSACAKSGFITSKYWGEQAILASGANAIIVRPSLLDGEGGYGAKWFRRVAAWPLQFVMQSKGLVAPLQVTDLGEAVAKLCLKAEKWPSIIELGGSDEMTIPQYLAKLRAVNRLNPAQQLAMPKLIVRLASHVFDVLACTPLSFGHFELMQGHNVPALNMLPILLGRKPTELGVKIEISQLAIDDLMAMKY